MFNNSNSSSSSSSNNNKQLGFTSAFVAVLTVCWASCSIPRDVGVSAFQIPHSNNSNNKKNKPSIPHTASSSRIFLVPPFSSSSSSLLSSTHAAASASQNPIAATAKATAAAATLAVLLTTFPCGPAFAASSDRSGGAAAQIMIDQIPPTTISIQANDIPVVGKIISGTYTKLDAKSVKGLTSPPSVVITGPKDKIKFLKAAATEGHIEVDIGGQVGLKTHLDVDIAADEAGIARVRVASDLVPVLPFKNLASSTPSSTSSSSKGGKQSTWNVVTNMGNGESYYFNTKTGITQFEKPEQI